MPDEVHSGGSPRDQSMEARVSAVEARLARLEAAVDEIRAELKAMRAEMTMLRLDVARIEGRLQNIPTTFQFVYMQGGFVLAIFAAAFALLRYAPLH